MIPELFTGADLLSLPVIAMLLFMAMFAAVLVRVYRRPHDGRYRHVASLPLEDDDDDR